MIKRQRYNGNRADVGTQEQAEDLIGGYIADAEEGLRRYLGNQYFRQNGEEQLVNDGITGQDPP